MSQVWNLSINWWFFRPTRCIHHFATCQTGPKQGPKLTLQHNYPRIDRETALLQPELEKGWKWIFADKRISQNHATSSSNTMCKGSSWTFFRPHMWRVSLAWPTQSSLPCHCGKVIGVFGQEAPVSNHPRLELRSHSLTQGHDSSVIHTPQFILGLLPGDQKHPGN